MCNLLFGQICVYIRSWLVIQRKTIPYFPRKNITNYVQTPMKWLNFHTVLVRAISNHHVPILYIGDFCLPCVFFGKVSGRPGRVSLLSTK